VTIEARFIVRRDEFTLDANLHIPSSGITSLFGPSGAGKTTLLRAIAGLDHHENGFLRVGTDIWQNDRRFLPPHLRSVGYVFQESSLFEHLTVKGNLEYGARRVPSRERSISLENAVEWLEIAPLLNRRPATLSGGERQRVAIARALAVSPKLLLMDEPLASVDTSRKQEIIPYIESLHRELDIPIVHVSHQHEEVSRLADHLVLMESGEIIAAGDVHEIFARLDLPLARGNDAASVIEAVVVGHDTQYQLTHMEFSGGPVVMARIDAAIGSTVRLRLAARDISLTVEHQTGTSILNILPVTVDELKPDGGAQILVRLLAGNEPVLARITLKSADDLKLAPGKLVFAQIKSIALLT